MLAMVENEYGVREENIHWTFKKIEETMNTNTDFDKIDNE